MHARLATWAGEPGLRGRDCSGVLSSSSVARVVVLLSAPGRELAESIVELLAEVVGRLGYLRCLASSEGIRLLG